MKRKPFYKVLANHILTAIVALSFVASATIQNFLFGVTLEIFGSSAHIALLASNAALLLIFGLPVAWVKHVDYGYLQDAHTHVVKKLIFRAGVSGATANLMQYAGFKYTPRTLQASFSNMVIPLYTVLTLASNSNFVQIYSTKALCGCMLITIGCMSHMSLYFLQAPLDSTMSIIFSNTLFLLAQVPFTWSVLWQQQTLATRRINPIFLIFKLMSAHAVVNLVFLPIFSVRTLTSRPWQGIINSLVGFFECLHGDDPYPNSQYALRVLLGLTFSTAATQFLQLVLVRRASYRCTASIILSIPCSVFTCQKILELCVASGKEWSGIMWVLGFSSSLYPLSLWMDAMPFTLSMIGAGLFRLHKANGLSREFCVSKEVLTSCPWRASLMGAPNLRNGNNTASISTGVVHRNTGGTRGGDTLSRRTSRPVDTSPPVRTLLSLKVTGVDAKTTVHLPVPGGGWPPVNNVQKEGDTINKKRSRVPLPRSEQADFPPLLRPVLTNTWCLVPCEYTDYKRHVDTYTEPLESASTAIEAYQPQQDRKYCQDADHRAGHSSPPEMQQLLTRAAFRPHLLAQYTMRHASILDSTHALMQQLRAFHTYGTIVNGTEVSPPDSMCC
eukprot:Lankesteria_metandrocarpae@DN4957_c0_g1_i1.p1